MVESGAVLGLGTGSTVEPFVRFLGDALGEGRLRGITAVPTSERTASLAREAGVPLTSLARVAQIDLAVDGADEVTRELKLVKGLGGALLREKMVAQASRRFVVVADASKRVGRLGEKAPLPVEVLPWEHAAHGSFFAELGAEASLRADGGSPYRTDNGNFIYHLAWPNGIDDPRALDERLRGRAGVVETGLFLGLAEAAIIGGADGVTVWRRNLEPDSAASGAA